jgi:predicted ATP-dependent protease
VLRPEVVEAIERGQFHLYPVRTVDEGIEVLTGGKAGRIDEPGTVHCLVAARLRELAEGLRRFAAGPARAGVDEGERESAPTE